MNTRLQVEHPVTEVVTGVDLVREQLRVAAGERLSFAQQDVQVSGHAIEFRLYAESPARGFTPTTGKALALRWPETPGVRVDSGILQGQAITSAFDPMLAKLIVHGGDRSEAIARADAALSRFALLGCETNAALLRRLVNHPAFAAGEIHTGFLDANPELGAEPPPSPATVTRLLAAAALSTRSVRDAADAIPPLHAAIGGWRN
jgi:acetyl/propionyl-CoA carboxylase alpha subunit